MSIGHTYLQSRPNVYNGGLVAQILSNLIVTDTSTNLNLYLNDSLDVTKYVTQFFLNSTSQVPYFDNSSVTFSTTSANNLPTSVFGLIYLALLFISCFLYGLLWTFWRTCSCQRQEAHAREPHDQDLTFYPRTMFQAKKKRFLNYTIICCFTCYCLFVAFLVCYTLSIMSQVSLQRQLIGSGTNTSFLSSWDQSANMLDTFINLALYNSFGLFNQTVNDVAGALNKALYGCLSNMTNDLLSTFGVTALFKNANILITNLQANMQSMQYVSDNSNSIISTINYRSGVTQATISVLKISIKRVCDSMSQNATCLTYLNASNFFRVPIDTNQISSSSSIAMIFVLNQFQLNVTTLSLQFSTMQSSFNNQIIAQTNAQISALNLYQSVNTIAMVWPFIAKTITPLKSGFSTISTLIASFLNIYGFGIFITTTVLLVAIVIMALCYILALIRYSVLFYCQKRLINSTAPMEHVQIIETIKSKYKIINPVIYSYIIVISLSLVFILAIALFIINASHLFYNEVCVQMWRSEGMIVNDRIISAFLNRYWGSIMTFIQAQNVAFKFTFLQPTTILSGIRNNCTNDYGIFYALGMSNFLNVSSFLWNPQNYQSLVNGLNITYAAFLSTNVLSVIPQSMTNFLISAQNVSAYFDQIDYQPTIDELSKRVIELPSYAAWVDSSIKYFSTINSSDANQTVVFLTKLKADVPQLQNLQISIQNLQANFQTIQNHRTNSLNIQTLLGNIQQVQTMLVNSPSTFTTVQTVYNQRMMIEFPAVAQSILTNLLAYLINHLFPCANLSSAINTMLNNLCSTDSTIESMASYGLYIAMTCGCFSVMLHFLWSIVRTDLDDAKNENTSIC